MAAGALTLAAVDRLVHRSAIFELNVESYRWRAAVSATRAKRDPSQVGDGDTPANGDVTPPSASTPKRNQTGTMT